MMIEKVEMIFGKGQISYKYLWKNMNSGSDAVDFI